MKIPKCFSYLQRAIPIQAATVRSCGTDCAVQTKNRLQTYSKAKRQ